MTRVKIAQFKMGLSRYLRSVRAGAEIIVMDRDTPVARVSPFAPSKPALLIEPATAKPESLKRLKGIGRRLDVDVVKLLREDRDRR